MIQLILIDLFCRKIKERKTAKSKLSDSVHSKRLIVSKNKGEKNNKEQRSDSVHSN